jgi:hypothetical protein
LDREKAIKADLLSKIQEIQMRLASEMQKIDSELKELGVIRSKKDKVRKARTVFKKVSDTELKEKLSMILSDGKKVSSSVIFKETNISRIRFNQFIQQNPSFIGSTGNRRSCVYFIA